MSQQWIHVIDQAVKWIEDGETENGLKALKKIEEHGERLPEVMMYLAEVWYQLGHTQDASRLLHNVLDRHPDLDETLRRECRLLLAEIALDEGDGDQAQTILYQLLDEGMDESRLYVLLADLYASEDLDEVAVKYMEMAREREPADQGILAALSELYLRTGKVEQALKLIDQLDAPDFSALLARARILAQQGEFESAYQLYRQLYERERSPEVLYGCGLMAFQLGRADEARPFVEALLALEEEYVTAYPLLADICLAMGDTKGAIRALKTYVDLSGFELSPLARLIALLKQEGRDDEAQPYEELYRQWNTEEDE